MIQHILKQLWTQRKSNIWIFLELLLVGVFLWYIVDRAIVDLYTYTKPKGFDASHIYRVKTSLLEPELPGYVAHEDDGGQTDGEDLFRLMDNLRLLPGVESVCASFFSSFYSRGNSTMPLVRDTATSFTETFHVRRVTPEFFDVFKIKSENGQPINSSLFAPSSTVLSKELKDIMFGNENAVGQRVKLYQYGVDMDNIPTSTVAAVTTSIRDTEYAKATPCFFQCLVGPTLWEMIDDFGVTKIEILMRVSPEADKDFVNKFLQQMGERTKVNNIYVSSIIPISNMRTEKLEQIWKDEKTRLSLVAFVLLNVFFGIIATFWLRTGYRRGEIALRMAMGANRNTIFQELHFEGFCLLLLTIIPVIILTLNIAYADYVDIDRLPFTTWRFVAGILITYFFLFAMIMLGVWYPARRAAKIEPATALHYE